MMPRSQHIVALVLGLAASLLTVALHAGEEPPTRAGADGLSLEAVDSRLAEVETAESLSKDDRSRIAGLYRQAKTLIGEVRKSWAAVAAYQSAIDSAPQETENLRGRLASLLEQPPDGAVAGVSAATPLTDLNDRLLKEEAELAARQATLQQLGQQLRLQDERPTAARAALAEARRVAAASDGAEDAAALAALDPLESDARRTLASARLEARAAETAKLEQELISYGVRRALLEARRDLAAQELVQSKARVTLLRSLVAEARGMALADAKARAEQAERDASGKHPVVRAAVKENAAIIRRLSELVGDLEGATRARQDEQDKATDLEAALERARRRVELAGLSTELAAALIQERGDLLTLTAERDRQPKQLRRERAAGRPHQAVAVELELQDVRDRREALLDVQEVLDDAMERVEPTMPEGERERLRSELAGLLRDRQDSLGKLQAGLSSYARSLSALDFARARVDAVLRDYSAFLDTHLLWMPSTYPVTKGSPAYLWKAVTWLADAEHWAGARIALVSDMQRNPAEWSVLAIVLVAMALASRRLRRELQALGQRVQRPSSDRFSQTLRALLASALLALPVPLILALVGWRLEASLEATDFSQLLANGLDATARALFGGLFALTICRSYGLGGAHFQWPEPALKLLRRKLRVFLWLSVPGVFLTSVLGRFADETYAVTVGRAAFLVTMLVDAYLLAGILSPRAAVVRPFLEKQSPQRFAQLWPLWYPAVAGAPLALAVLAAAGYYYTALELAQPALQTLALGFVAILLYGLALRWLAVGRRDMALKLARENREAAQAARSTQETGAAQVPLVSPRADLDRIDTQTRQLLNMLLLIGAPVSLWLIWSDVLPAFSLFEQVSLWHYNEQVDGQTVTRAVTLWNLMAAIFIAVVVGIATRSVPGVLELAVLRHLELERGSRYAIKTLLQYAILTLGILLVFGKLGASWSQMQWLVAALSVGLGFGLQEIVANFICGIIILFERPVRIGDWVTVGNLSGTVSNISIRATTITDFDRKEIIVPNKAFITTDVVNWSLSDPITRIKIRVGIAYGANVARARQVMLDTVRNLPLVRSDPEPRVWFVGFGESSLDFDVLVFASELSDRLPLTHAVHVALEKALRDNGIEIPFPQRDLHLRSVSPDAGGFLRGGERPEGEPGF